VAEPAPYAAGQSQDDWYATLDAVLNPAAIAIIGASNDRAKTGGRILRSVRNGGYRGRVVLVNPRYDSIDGYPCVPSVEETGMPVPEVAYIALPREAAIEQVTRCGAAGIRGCIVVGTGFGEDSQRGRRLQDKLRQAAASAGVRLIGPNCIGFISSRRSLNLEAAITLQEPARPGPVGIISQSGSLMLCLYHGIADAGSGISFGVSVGNQVDLGVAELMSYAARDPATTVLAVYAESLGNADDFLRAAAACRSAGTRVLILKAGGSAVGAEVTASHTAAILGSRGAFEAACRGAGVLIADDIDVMAEAAAVLTRWQPPAPAAVAVMSSSGGGAAVLADRLESAGLGIATLRRSTVESLSAALNPIGRRAVIDFGRRQDGKPPLNSAELCNVLMADPGVGAGLFSLTVTPAMTERCEAVVAAAHEQGKLIVATMFPGSATGSCLEVLRAGHLPCLPHVDSALRLLALLQQAARHQPGPRRRHTSRRGPAGSRARQSWLPPDRVAALLDHYGIPRPAAGLATTRDDAVALAAQLGYPVALKIAAAGLVHKSDTGGVVLDLRDAAAVRGAWDLIAERTGLLSTGQPSGCLVQKMATGVAELLLGVQNDPQFGAVLTVGAGGLLAELIGDVQVCALPVSARTARDMLARLALWPVLAGYRGAEAADVRAVAAAMAAVSALAAGRAHEIREVEINPLIVGRDGAGVVAVDARIRLAASQ
jgi:acyl-CoA synthetase (NDP forming)